MEAPLPVDEPTYVAFFGVMGATAAMVFSALGAAYGTAKSGTGRIYWILRKYGFHLSPKA